MMKKSKVVFVWNFKIFFFEFSSSQQWHNYNIFITKLTKGARNSNFICFLHSLHFRKKYLNFSKTCKQHTRISWQILHYQLQQFNSWIMRMNWKTWQNICNSFEADLIHYCDPFPVVYKFLNFCLIQWKKTHNKSS